MKAQESHNDTHTDTHTDTQKSKNWVWLPFVIASLFVLLVFCGYWIAVDTLIENSAERGMFGDKFGGVTALFSGLAFAALIVTLHLQRDELRLQREELGDTRTVLEQQRLQLEAQANSLERQRVETTFFNLLTRHTETLNSIRTRHEANWVSGRASLDPLIFQFQENYKQHADGTARNNTQQLFVHLANSWNTLFENQGQVLSTYFDHTIVCLQFIEKLTDDKEKDTYARIFRAQLSTSEKELIFYCSLHDDNSELKRLTLTYELLDGLERSKRFENSYGRQGHQLLRAFKEASDR